MHRTLAASLEMTVGRAAGILSKIDANRARCGNRPFTIPDE
jgi:hypothetical protein